MNVSDLVFLDSTGYHFADFPTIQQWVTDQFKNIYGADIVTTPDTQDGQFLALIAQACYDTAALGSSIYNSFSPPDAQGVGLSRLVKINGLAREKASFSVVTLTIVGTVGTVIQNGQAMDVLNQIWLLPASVTIPSGGTVNVIATAQQIGAITAAPNTITTIFTPTRGWQTVNNSGAATPGAPVETDAELRVRQARSTSIPALTVFDATLGAVSNLPGVTDVQGYENDTDTTDSNGLPPHSICVVVSGGNSTQICQTILQYKTPGTNTHGNTTVLVYDSRGLPLYISYQTSVAAEIGVQVTLSRGAGWTDDYIAEIQNAIASYINANGIGNTIFYTKLFEQAYLSGTAPANAYTISDIETQKNSGGFSPANITLTFDEQPVCNPTVDVDVIVT